MKKDELLKKGQVRASCVILIWLLLYGLSSLYEYNSSSEIKYLTRPLGYLFIFYFLYFKGKKWAYVLALLGIGFSALSVIVSYFFLPLGWEYMISLGIYISVFFNLLSKPCKVFFEHQRNSKFYS